MCGRGSGGNRGKLPNFRYMIDRVDCKTYNVQVKTFQITDFPLCKKLPKLYISFSVAMYWDQKLLLKTNLSDIFISKMSSYMMHIKFQK